ETLTDMVTDAKHVTRAGRLFRKYVSDYVTRYKGARVIEFWELTNEMNLLADLDMKKRSCEKNTQDEICLISGNFSTAQMVGFLERTADLIRSVDPSKKISSGLALPRGSAYHLVRQPEWSAKGPDWTSDT